MSSHSSSSMLCVSIHKYFQKHQDIGDLLTTTSDKFLHDHSQKLQGLPAHAVRSYFSDLTTKMDMDKVAKMDIDKVIVTYQLSREKQNQKNDECDPLKQHIRSTEELARISNNMRRSILTAERARNGISINMQRSILAEIDEDDPIARINTLTEELKLINQDISTVLSSSDNKNSMWDVSSDALPHRACGKGNGKQVTMNALKHLAADVNEDKLKNVQLSSRHEKTTEVDNDIRRLENHCANSVYESLTCPFPGCGIKHPTPEDHLKLCEQHESIMKENLAQHIKKVLDNCVSNKVIEPKDKDEISRKYVFVSPAEMLPSCAYSYPLYLVYLYGVARPHICKWINDIQAQLQKDGNSDSHNHSTSTSTSTITSTSTYLKSCQFLLKSVKLNIDLFRIHLNMDQPALVQQNYLTYLVGLLLQRASAEAIQQLADNCLQTFTYLFLHYGIEIIVDIAEYFRDGYVRSVVLGSLGASCFYALFVGAAAAAATAALVLFAGLCSCVLSGYTFYKEWNAPPRRVVVYWRNNRIHHFMN